MTYTTARAAALCTLLAGMAHTAAASEPIFTHQGRLLDAAGAPVQGAHNLDVYLFGQATGGAATWHKTFAGVVLEDGFFTVTLQGLDNSSVDLASVLVAESPTYLDLGLDSVVVPSGAHSAIRSVPEAYRASHATAVDASVASGTVVGSNVWAGTDILLRSFPFTKKRADSDLLVLWYDNLRCYGNAVACKWEVRFRPAASASGAGTSCVAPGAIVADWYNSADGAPGVSLNLHLPTTVASVCQTYGAPAAAFAAGDYVAEIYLLQHPHSAPEGGAFTGWEETIAQLTVLEVN